MNYSLGLKPFKDYWLNCYYNMIFSILISIEPSYKLAAYLNDYIYDIYELETPTKTKFNCLKLKTMINFRAENFNNLFYPPQPVEFKHDNNYIKFLKDLIKKKEFVTVGVDLFYWIPNSVCWNKHHWNHYSLINGFNSEKKVFYVFDENFFGYNEFEIPEERFSIAVQNSPLEPNGYIYKLKNEIERYKFSINDVIYNAERLKDELGATNSRFLWQLSDEDFDAGHMCDLISMYIFQIINRQVANQLLFQTIQDEIQNNEIINSLMQYVKNLQTGWSLVKNKIVKVYFTKDRKDSLIDINEKCKILFNTEYEMWDKFLTFLLT